MARTRGSKNKKSKGYSFTHRGPSGKLQHYKSNESFRKQAAYAYIHGLVKKHK